MKKWLIVLLFILVGIGVYVYTDTKLHSRQANKCTVLRERFQLEEDSFGMYYDKAASYTLDSCRVDDSDQIYLQIARIHYQTAVNINNQLQKDWRCNEYYYKTIIK